VKERLNLSQLVPEAYQILMSMEKYLAKSEIPLVERELVKIRASQINKCAYCLDMHTRDARKNGESEQRLYALAAWKESPLFTAKERALLSFTDCVSQISLDGVTDVVYNELKIHYSEKQIAQLIILINQINFWNRNAVAAHLIFKEIL
jgi:AhpD family alkylhydroperoxidase